MAARVVVACGSGVATSEMVAAKVSLLIEAAGERADVVAVEMSQLDEALEGADAYVAVVKTDGSYDVPVINGVAFVTGMNQDEELARLLEIVRAAR